MSVPFEFLDSQESAREPSSKASVEGSNNHAEKGITTKVESGKNERAVGLIPRMQLEAGDKTKAPTRFMEELLGANQKRVFPNGLELERSQSQKGAYLISFPEDYNDQSPPLSFPANSIVAHTYSKADRNPLLPKEPTAFALMNVNDRGELALTVFNESKHVQPDLSTLPDEIITIKKDGSVGRVYERGGQKAPQFMGEQGEDWQKAFKSVLGDQPVKTVEYPGHGKWTAREALTSFGPDTIKTVWLSSHFTGKAQSGQWVTAPDGKTIVSFEPDPTKPNAITFRRGNEQWVLTSPHDHDGGIARVSNPENGGRIQFTGFNHATTDRSYSQVAYANGDRQWRGRECVFPNGVIANMWNGYSGLLLPGSDGTTTFAQNGVIVTQFTLKPKK